MPHRLRVDIRAVPLSLVAVTHNMLVVTPSLSVQSVQELIAHARSNPGKLNMSNAGSGFQSHLAGVLFTHMTGRVAAETRNRFLYP